jgi:NADH-quinone oxidoreductase subunit N
MFAATAFAPAALAQVTAPPAPSVAWWGLVPLIILVAGAVLLLTIASLVKPLPKRFFAGWTVAVALGAIIATIPPWTRVHHHGPTSTLSGMVGIDGFSLFLTVVICISVVLAALLADDYLRREDLDGAEVYVLLLLSASGGVVMAGANDLIILFLGLEALSIAVYVLAAIHLRRIESQEAGLKYFVLGAISSAFFLYGIALTYGATGSTNLATIKTFLAANSLTEDAMLLAGLALMLVGLGFKIAAVPFHTWSPDVYQGSPSPVVAYMASGVKAAGFAGLLRVYVVAFDQYANDWQPAIYALAIASLLVGSILAIVQTDVKRMLAYSSINHAGFILLGVQAASDKGTSSALFYLAAYTFMVVGSFGVVTVVGGKGDSRHSLDDYRGLANRRPLLALVFTLLLLAQAGVPFTIGFFAKLGVVQAAIEARSFWLALVAMVSSVISAFLYLRIVITMFSGDDTATEHAPALPVPAGAVAVLFITCAVTIGFGILPDVVVNLARDAVPTLVAARP